MNINDQINDYIANQTESKKNDMQVLNQLIQRVLPEGKLWFDDGINNEGKTISNPMIGYGTHTIKYANGTTKDFFQIGMSANTTGISIYILGIKDKTYLAQTFGSTLGKAKVSGYCIKFKALNDIDVNILETAIRYGVAASA